MDGKNNGFFKCPFCGGDLLWCSDAAESDVSLEYDENDTAIVYYLTCQRCGRDYEVFDPPTDARMNEYKDYWLYGN